MAGEKLPQSEIVYQAEAGKLKIDVCFEGETVWLTQQHIAALFQSRIPNISMYIRSVFAATCR
jgi:hypothetical protein